MKSVLGNPNVTEEEATTLRNMLKETGSYQYVIDKGWSFVHEAIEFIPKITTDKKLSEILKSLVVYMMERTK